MKIAAVVDPIEASGLGEGNVFSIASNSKAFEILSRQVYSDPVAAVIREITCNAADAHKLTGRPIADIEVKLPTLFEPDFWVRDYGPGLSIADVRGLYTTYFASTKDQSDDMIGGFGIGSKSPFAVSDQFTITSWHGGFCSEFVCYKENGAPRINMIRSIPSDEPTGLKVQVAANNAHMWSQAAIDFFTWWPEVPSSLSHITPIFPTLNYRSAHMEGPLAKWYVQSRVEQSYVLMGGVRYQIDAAKVPYFYAFTKDWRNRGHSFVLVAPLGAVSPQPSREALNYNDSTVAWLEGAIKDAITELHADTLNKFQAITSLYEARKFCHTANSELPFFHHLKSQLKFNGDYPSNYVHHYPTTYTAVTYTRSSYTTGWRTNRNFLTSNCDNPSVKYLWLPGPAGSSHYSRIRNEHPHKSEQHYALVWGDTLANIQADLDAQGFPPNCLVDFTTAFPPLPPPARKPRSQAVPRDIRGYKQGHHRNSWADKQQVLDLSVPSYWVETQAREITDQSLRLITQFIVDHMTVPITRINASQLTDKARATLKKRGWTEITSSFFQDQPNSFLDTWIKSRNRGSIDARIQHIINIYGPKLPATCKLKLAIDAFNPIVANTSQPYPMFTQYLPYFSAAQQQYITDNQSTFGAVYDTFKAELDKFPLLPHIQLTNACVPAILDYLST